MRCEKELVTGSEKNGFKTAWRPPQEVSRRSRTLQGLEVGANLAPRGVPKSIQNRSKSELASPQDPRPSRDSPKILKWTPKWVPNRCEINFEIHSKFIHHRCEMRVQTLLEACRYASMQVCRYEGMRYAGMKVCRYVGVKVCKYE